MLALFLKYRPQIKSLTWEILKYPWPLICYCETNWWKSLNWTNNRLVSYKLWMIKYRVGGRDNSVGIATVYGLDGPEIESRWGRDFLDPSRPAWGPTQLLYNGHRVFPGGKAAGSWRWPPTPSSAEVKERAELYLYSPFGPSWPVLGWNLLFLPSTFYFY